ncbi:deoxynucleoside triphosphate triphosphohydrolase SAMHD1-like [Amphiura filiformis]|uniref:deoxynucleoside triphosphate triphosphohydrolase SAMHD1-like n=1 Tax=Amphiura filiformis TaxID=82378 RepID=UPI003B21F76D
MNTGKVFQDEVHGPMSMPDYCCKVIDTPEFQRLRSIKQLGGAEYVYPGATHTRFSHSLGVCHLALLVVEELKKNYPIDEDDEKCVVLAGLCHDLGHGPLSHKFEDVVNEVRKPTTDADKWTHEKASVLILERLKDKFDFGESKEKMTMRIRDFIMGKPEKVYGHSDKCGNGEKCGDYIRSENMTKGVSKGLRDRWDHYEKKRFLYQIISNSDSGIDVDKWDYLRRDCNNLGLTNDFNHNRVISYMQVLPCKRKIVPDEVEKEKCKRKIGSQSSIDTTEVCFRTKIAKDIAKMLNSRWNNHEQACKHRVVMVIERMFTDVLVMYFRYNERFSKHPIIDDILKDRPEDMEDYLQMTDHILNDIAKLAVEKQDPAYKAIEEMQDILNHIKIRKLYTLIGSVTKGNLSEKVDVEEIKKQILEKRGMKEEYKKYIKKDNLVVITHRLDYGKKEPLAEAFFFEKDGTVKLLSEDEKPINFKETAQSHSIHVYSKEYIADDTLVEGIKKFVEPTVRRYVENLTPAAGTERRASTSFGPAKRKLEMAIDTACAKRKKEDETNQ